MPPLTTARNSKTSATAFGRAHPTLQRALLLSCEAGPFLLVAAIVTSAGLWKRPMWQRAMLWRVALWSFLSRWVLVGCAVTWSWNEWGREEVTEEREQRGQEGGDAPDMRRVLEEVDEPPQEAGERVHPESLWPEQVQGGNEHNDDGD